MSEFHGIILAGPGRSLFPLTGKPSLPLCNAPLLQNAFNWMDAAGIHRITVVCHPSDASWVKDWTGKHAKHADVVVNSDSGSVNALRNLDIEHDFVVMPCDSFSQVPPHYLLDTHRLLLPSMTCLLHDARLESSPIAVQRGANKDETVMQYIGLDSNSNLLYLGFGEDIEESDDDAEGVPLRHSLLRSKPKFTIYTHLRDVHIYIFRKWVLNWIRTKPHLVSLQRDVVPVLIKAQYAGSRWRERQGLDACTYFAVLTNPQVVQPPPQHILSAMRYSTSVAFDFDSNHPPITCAAVVFPDTMGARVSTPWAYLALNRELSQGQNTSLTATAGSIVKRSWIGHATIESGCKVIDSVVMDKAIVHSHAKIEGCVIGKEAKIGKNCHLIACDVANRVVVADGTNAKNESFDVQTDLSVEFGR